MQEGASVYSQGLFKEQRPEARYIRAIAIIQKGPGLAWGKSKSAAMKKKKKLKLKDFYLRSGRINSGLNILKYINIILCF